MEGGNQAGSVWQPYLTVKNRKQKEFRAFDYQFYYPHALYVGYNVTNALYNRMNGEWGSEGLLPEIFLQMPSIQRWKMSLCKFPEHHTGRYKDLLVVGLYLS